MVKMVDMDETVEMVETAILNRLEKVLKFWGFFLYRHPYGLKVFVLFFVDAELQCRLRALALPADWPHFGPNLKPVGFEASGVPFWDQIRTNLFCQNHYEPLWTAMNHYEPLWTTELSGQMPSFWAAKLGAQQHPRPPVVTERAERAAGGAGAEPETGPSQPGAFRGPWMTRMASCRLGGFVLNTIWECRQFVAKPWCQFHGPLEGADTQYQHFRELLENGPCAQASPECLCECSWYQLDLEHKHRNEAITNALKHIELEGFCLEMIRFRMVRFMCSTDKLSLEMWKMISVKNKQSAQKKCKKRNAKGDFRFSAFAAHIFFFTFLFAVFWLFFLSLFSLFFSRF